MLDQKQKIYIEKLLEKYNLPIHETDYFGYLGFDNFIVFNGVLSPEKSLISPLFADFLYKNRKFYQNYDVLELGCGSGILSIIMAKYGAKKVVATDILGIAVRNTLENSKRYGLGSVLEAREGDLFDCINEKSDLIVFNHPFFHDKPIKGDTISVALLDDGKIIRKFSSNVSKYLKFNGKIITAFSEIARGYNDPKVHAEKHSLLIRELISFNTKTGKKFIYELRQK